MFAVDPQQRIIAWNQAAEVLLGYSAEEVVGRCCYDVIQGRDCNGGLQCSAHCPHFEQGKRLPWVRHMDLQSRSKSGQDIWISVTTVSIVSPRRKLSALVHLFRQADATDPANVPLAGLKPSSPGEMAGQENGSASPFPLSNREMEVLTLMDEGLSTKEIAAKLFISPNTVRNHVENILRKLKVHTRLEAILWAIHRRLV